jgi:anaerobic magnesium-protoporphyrin IX monomethyl ester cyclase
VIFYFESSVVTPPVGQYGVHYEKISTTNAIIDIFAKNIFIIPSELSRAIGIIAPFYDSYQYQDEFHLRFKANNRQFTLASFHELAQKGYSTDKLSRGFNYEEDLPSAGYYLEGLMHQEGYDTFLTSRYDQDTLLKVAEKDPMAVLVSTTMVLSVEGLIRIFSAIRKAIPGTFIIAGGVFIWKNYLSYSRYPDAESPWDQLFDSKFSSMDADIMIAAPHGRSYLLQVLEELKKGSKRSFDDIPNLVIPRNGKFIFTRREEETVDYNTDFTRWDLVERIIHKIPLRTSIGCPYRCVYCDFNKLYPKVFLRSPESIAEELRLANERFGKNPAIVHFSDDNLFINRRRINEICNAIMKSGFKKWMAFMRANDYTEDEYNLMERSGLMLAFIGVESGDQGQLDRMKKKQDVQQLKRTIENLDAHFISTFNTFIVGYPGETKGTIQNTIRFLNELSLTYLTASYEVFLLRIHPLTDLTEPANRAKWGLKGFNEDWSHNTMNKDEALQGLYTLFKEVNNTPYHYAEESHFFNRMKYSFDVKRSFFQLRHQLTIKLIENEPWQEVENVLKEMAHQLNLPVDGLDGSFRDEIIRPLGIKSG